MRYLAKFEPDKGGGYTVTFPDVPEAITEGNNKQDALKYAREVLEGALMFYVDAGEALPEAKTKRGRDLVAIDISAAAAAKFELYSLFRETGIRKSELARRMGIPKSNVDRLFSLKRNTSIDLLESAYRALGRRLKFSADEAA